MVFVTGRRYLAGGLLLVMSNLCFGATIVLYNAYLNDITPDDQRDAVSSRGYALGYLGGGLLLAANLATILGAPALGISKDLAVRLSLLSAGLWWGGFSIVTFTRLKPRAGKKIRSASAQLKPRSTDPLRLSRYTTYVTIGVSELISSFRELRVLPGTLRYLIAYMFFNDGIQTVISIASVFLAQELFVAKGLETNESFLIGLILMVQFVAFFGSLLFERIAAFGGTKNAILLSLLVWSAIVIYAYGFLQTTLQAWVMGAVIALVLGGSQALSRSIFSQMIPAGREAAFFGVYEISERGTSWIGPLIFGAVVGSTGSYRQAILSLIALFVVGMIVLFLTDTDRAIRDAERVPRVHDATELS
jgi:UMF1 family MFS transporter